MARYTDVDTVYMAVAEISECWLILDSVYRLDSLTGREAVPSIAPRVPLHNPLILAKELARMLRAAFAPFGCSRSDAFRTWEALHKREGGCDIRPRVEVPGTYTRVDEVCMGDCPKRLSGI